LSLTGEPGVDRCRGRDVNIRHKDSQEGGRARPVVASIEGEDDSVADANLGVTDAAVFEPDLGRFDASEGAWFPVWRKLNCR
jgi:hypothetical protein